MAMIKCPECGKEVSDKAEVCVNCGCPISKASNVPKCPTCGSTNVEKISLGSKVVGGAMFGLFSSNVRKTMKCNHCGHKW